MKSATLPSAIAWGALCLLGTRHPAHAQYDYYYPYYNFVRESTVNPGYATFGYSIGYASYQDWQTGTNPGNPTITFDDPNQGFNGGYVWNRSVINFLNSSGGYGWSLYGSSTFNMRGGKLTNNGSANGHIIAYQNSHITMSGGSVQNYVSVTDNGTAEITGGTIGESLTVQQNSRVTMSGGTVGQNVQGSENGRFIFSRGSVGAAGFRDNSRLDMTGGSVGGDLYVDSGATDQPRAYVSGGSIGRTVYGNAGKTYISGGTVGGYLAALSDSGGVIYLLGGTVNGDLKAWHNGTINISGGIFGGVIEVTGNGTVNLYGTGLSASPPNPNSGYGGPYLFNEYTLFGTLADGTDVTGKKIYMIVYPGETPKFFLHNTTTATGAVSVRGLASAQNVTLTFQPEDGSPAFVRTVSASSSAGSFSVANLIPQRYTVRLTSEHALAKNITIDTTSGDISGMTADLSLGDANADNAVDISDLLLLVSHYNQSQSGGAYLPAADFNNDGANDLADLLLLITSYNQMGDS